MPRKKPRRIPVRSVTSADALAVGRWDTGAAQLTCHDDYTYKGTSTSGTFSQHEHLCEQLRPDSFRASSR